MIGVFNKATGARVGEISEEQFQFLVDWLEEEGLHDSDYFIEEATIDTLVDAGADEDLLTVLRKAIEGKGEAEIAFKGEVL